MKKVLSVAMASAMVLGMGANAFAIQYNVSSSDSAEWPEKFQFDGELFVTDKDGKKKTTQIEDENEAVFNPGDVIWMPLYADNQLVYDVAGDSDAVKGKEEVRDVKLTNPIAYTSQGGGQVVGDITTTEAQLPKAYADREIKKGSVKYYIGSTKYTDEAKFKEALQEALYAEGVKGVKEEETKVKNSAYITVTVAAVEGTDAESGNAVTDGSTDYTVYTGNIDKDWSINLIEEKGKVSELIEKAELYKATSKDAQKYGATAKGVYLKVSLKKEWPSAETANLKYYVYISENGSENKTTNKVWVSGDYENALTKAVDFTWTNNANTPAVWEVKEGSGNGYAVFDYNDKAFFTVKMYEGEKLYLDLKTAYDRATSNKIYDASGAEVESFYNFVTGDANFSRKGELVLVTDDDALVPYEVDADGNLVEVEAEYVENYTLGNTNKKVNGFKFETKELGNYILSDEIVVEEEVEEPATEEPAEETPAEPEAPVVEEKPNPNTGAEDFVGLAVSLAVVSVAAAGALALKK